MRGLDGGAAALPVGWRVRPAGAGAAEVQGVHVVLHGGKEALFAATVPAGREAVGVTTQDAESNFFRAA